MQIRPIDVYDLDLSRGADMYLYIFDNTPGKILLLPKAPMRNSQLTHRASVILSFHIKGGLIKVIKNRYGGDSYPVDKLAEKYLGIRLFDDGFFISDKDLMIFTLKYSNVQDEKLLDFPLI